MSETDDLSLAHLQAELARIDVLIQREVRRWQLAGQDPNDTFRGLRVSDDEAVGLLNRPFGASWGATAELGSEQAAFEAALAAAQTQSSKIAARAKKQNVSLRLRHLVDTFKLDSFDLDAFLICLAPTLDLRYERLYGYLQDDVTRRRPSVNLVLDLLCEPGPGRLLQLTRFADDAPLLAHALLERAPEAGGLAPSLLGQSLLPDEAIVAWLLGNYRPHADLAGHARLIQAGTPEHDDILAGKAWPALQPALRATGGRPPVLVFHGPDQAGQEAAARLVAGDVGRSLLQIDLAQVVSPEKTAPEVVRAALRDARLTGAIPCLLGWDACLAPDTRTTPVGDIQAQVNAFPHLVVIAGTATWQARGREQDRNLVWMEFPVPDFAHRQALWQHFIEQSEARLPQPVSDLDLVDLAGQFSLTSLQIHDAAAAAADQARLRGGTLDRAELFQAARSYSSPGLANLAHKIEARYTWSDIVLPTDQLSMLKELIATVRGRPMVLETWGVGDKLAASAGVTILFAGPPGTGKTMAAEVIASELGLELYKIDLSTVVNKYIGETEKNLGRIFDEASNSNAILFFDEADAIFGKRSEVKDAHDRYANIEVSYLLQRMETYDGVTILATNLRANLDDAFTRRLQFAVDFPFPDEAYRLRIWEALFPESLPRAGNIDLRLLAQRFKLAGGNIRNIIVSAAYLAAADGGEVTMAHLLHGARRELQKMGRLVKEKEMTLG
jgi:hypothetical protein